MRKNAPVAWEIAKRPVTDHRQEIHAALELLSDKGVDAIRCTANAGDFALRRDCEIMAALAVLAIHQPYLLCAIGTYEMGKPAIFALTKLGNKAWDDFSGSDDDLTDNDWEALARLLPNITPRSATASA